ncbi:MAG: hypothetical protein Q8O84_02505 [Nanoarchaeota archaeon]|nr:hypothetical protein [Nanoarchaeota archaeon]
MEIEYKINLKKYKGEYRLTNYQDNSGSFKSPIPTTEQDREVVKNLKGLAGLLNSNELNVKMKIK